MEVTDHAVLYQWLKRGHTACYIGSEVEERSHSML